MPYLIVVRPPNQEWFILDTLQDARAASWIFEQIPLGELVEFKVLIFVEGDTYTHLDIRGPHTDGSTAIQLPVKKLKKKTDFLRDYSGQKRA